MLTVTLYGTCRRYRRMKQTVLAEAARLAVPIQLEEIGDTDSLSRLNPLSLPLLYIDGELVASQNPPAPDQVARALRLKSVSR
jgi:hypothetical protein